MKRRNARKPRPRTGFAPLLWIGVLAAAVLVVASIRERREPRALPAEAPLTARYGYRIVRAFPHDPQAFTQGLVFHDGFLFESTGLAGRSSLRKVRLETGEVLQQRTIDPPHFAEGLADWQDRLVQLTWRSGIGFEYDMAAFDLRRTFPYEGEGWGLARDTNRLIMSDGTSILRFLDPASLKETGVIAVTEGNSPVPNLNELEVVKGRIFANVWQSDDIVMIDPATGSVTGRIDLSGLLPAREQVGVDVLNGIAYDAAKDRLFVTGKLWPRLFEIKIEPRR